MKKFVFSILIILLRIFLTVLLSFILPLVIVFLIPGILCRQVVSLFTKIVWKPKGFGKMLTAAASAHAIDLRRGTIVLPLTFEGTPDLSNILDQFEKKIMYCISKKTGTLKYPELQQGVTTFLGFYFWKEVASFNVKDNFHVVELKDGEKVDLIGGKGKELLLELTKKPFRYEEETLWEVVLIPRVEVEGATESEVPHFCLILRFHHALSDSMSLVKMLHEASNMPRFKDDIKISKWKFALQRGLRFLRAPWDLSGMVLTKNVDTFISKDKELSFDLTVATRYFDVARIKNVANRFKVRFTAVALTIISGGIKRSNTKIVLDDALVHFPIGVPNHPDKLRNVGMMGTAKLPMKDNEMVCLRKIQRGLEDLQSSSEPLIFQLFGILVGAQWTFVTKSLITGAAMRPSFGFTNIPLLTNPNEEIWLFGSLLVRIGPGTLNVIGSRKFFISLLSSGGSGSLCIGVDSGILSEKEAEDILTGCLEELCFLEWHSGSN